MRFGKFGTLSVLAMLGTMLALGACTNAVPAPLKDAGYESYRQAAETTVRNLGFPDAVATIEDETSKTKASKPSPTPSLAKGGKTSQSIKASPSSAPPAQNRKLIEVTFTIPGTKCTGDIEQELEPKLGSLAFDEVTLPDGTEHAREAKPPVQLNLADIFAFASEFEACRIPGVTEPNTANPSANATARLGASPETTS